VKHAATIAALLLLVALGTAVADDKLKRADSAPTGAPAEIKRVRFIGADTTPTRAGQLEGGPRTVAFSADGKLLAVGAVDGGVGITSVVEASDQVSGWHRVAEHLGSVSGVLFLAGANQLEVVSTGDDETIHVAALDASLAVVSSASRPLGLGPLTALAALDATHVAVGSARGSVAVIRLGDAITVERTFERHEGAIVAIVALGKGRIATAGWDGLVKLSDTATGKELKTAKISTVELTSLAASPDGHALVVGSWKTGVQLLDSTSLKPLATVEPHRGAANGVLLVGAKGAALDKCRLVTSSVADEMLAATSEPLGAKNELKGLKRTRLTAVPTGALAVSPDGTLVACAANDGSVGLYQLEGGK
jgi:WD40 repeat protein